MASPQPENGFTRVANEILEAVMSRGFTGQQFRVLLALWRETYGWQRTQAPFSLGQAERLTGLRRKRVMEVLRELTDLGVVTLVEPGSPTKSAVYRFCKDYDSWVTGCPPTGGQGVPSQGDRGCPLDSDRGCPLDSDTSKKGERKAAAGQGVPSQGDTSLQDLGTRVLRQLTQLQPSGLSRQDRLAVAELLRNTDKSPRRVLEAVTDAVRETQMHRRSNQTRAPVRFALSVAGRMLSEPEPNTTEPKFVTAPEGWTLGANYIERSGL